MSRLTTTHATTISRLQVTLDQTKADLQGILDEIEDDEDIDDDIKEGLEEIVGNLDNIKDDLGGFTAETQSEG